MPARKPQQSSHDKELGHAARGLRARASAFTSYGCSLLRALTLPLPKSVRSTMPTGAARDLTSRFLPHCHTSTHLLQRFAGDCSPHYCKAAFSALALQVGALCSGVMVPLVCAARSTFLSSLTHSRRFKLHTSSSWCVGRLVRPGRCLPPRLLDSLA